MVEMRRFRKSQKNRQRRGGALSSAPLNYSLAEGMAAKQSMAQGDQYLDFHKGQHGGAFMGAPLSAIESSALPSSLSASAGTDCLDRAFADIAGLSDQAGGKRRRRASKRSKRSKRTKKGGKRSKKGGKRSKKGGKRTKRSKRSKRSGKTRRTRGGSLSFSPYPGRNMLLNDYSNTGLNPDWNSDVAFDMAYARAAQ